MNSFFLHLCRMVHKQRLILNKQKVFLAFMNDKNLLGDILNEGFVGSHNGIPCVSRPIFNSITMQCFCDNQTPYLLCQSLLSHKIPFIYRETYEQCSVLPLFQLFLHFPTCEHPCIHWPLRCTPRHVLDQVSGHNQMHA